MKYLSVSEKTLLSHAIANANGWGVYSMNFDELVEYGKSQPFVNIVGDMPWSFKIGDIAVTHEDDNKYLIGNMAQVFTRNDVLLFTQTTSYLREQGFKDEFQILPKEIYHHFFK